TKFKEALLFVERSQGILISCDSIKNWQQKDPYFDDATFEMMKKAESVGAAKIDKTWLQAMQPSKKDIDELAKLDFSILITAHGEPITKDAKELLLSSIKEVEKYWKF